MALVQKGKTLLIIDDDEIFHFAAQQLNKRDQVFEEVHCFVDAEDALSYLDEVKETMQIPDVILLDIRLGNASQSGWSFLEKYNSNALQKVVEKATLYMVSSSIDPKDKGRASEHPLVKGYLEKPLRFGILQTLLNGR